MRTQWAVAVAAATALLTGCVITPMTQSEFSSPFFTNFANVASSENQYPPPYVLSYPDETMYFYRIWQYHPRADLNLRAIGCARTTDGALVVTASVQNMGADVVPTDGTKQEVEAFVPVPMAVTGTVDQRLARTRYLFNDVRRIDVVADPDRIVPDPVRLNNVLTWQGTMSGDTPSCEVVRS